MERNNFVILELKYKKANSYLTFIEALTLIEDYCIIKNKKQEDILKLKEFLFYRHDFLDYCLKFSMLYLSQYYETIAVIDQQNNFIFIF